MLIPILFVVAFGLTIFHSYWYYPFIADDALISLRYAERMLAGEGLTWTSGRPVEGYSNLLWVLLLAGIGFFGVDLIDAARALGLTCTAITFTAVLYALRERRPVAALVAMVFLGLSGPFAVWLIGGLEQPLCTALLGWSIALSLSKRPKCSEYLVPVLLGLLCITRPDSPLFVAAFVISSCFAPKRTSVPSLAKLLVVPMLFYGAQLVFRLFYYGEWVPNTARVKITFNTYVFDLGWNYVSDGLMILAPFSFLALASMALMAFNKSTRGQSLLFTSLTGLWLIYLICVGGDIFPAWRHFLPIMVVFAIAIGIGVDFAFDRIRKRRDRIAIGLALAFAFAFYYNAQLRDPKNLLAATERWEWDGQVIGLVLKEAFGDQQPLYAVDNAGCLPYFSGLPALDMLGLNDHYLAHHPPPNIGTGYLGHEFGDGDYLWRRRPDLISFNSPAGNRDSFSRGGMQMQQRPEFFRDYTKVFIRGRNPYDFSTLIWVLKYSEKIGIRDEGVRIEIPGFLFATTGAAAYLNENGDLVTPVSASQPGTVVINRNLDGDWGIRLVTSDLRHVAVEIEPVEQDQTRIIVSASGEAVVEIGGMTLEKSDG